MKKKKGDIVGYGLRAIALVLALGVGACAGPMRFEKPGATESQFKADSCACEQNAEILARLRNPDLGNQSAKPGAGFGVALARGVVMGLEKRSEYKKCLESRGYMEVRPVKS